MNIIELEKKGYTGIDADLETSLFEYGLIWAKNDQCTKETEYHCYYKIGELFGCGYIVLTEFIEELQSGWMSDFDGSYCGITQQEVIDLLNAGDMNMLHSLLQYYGNENIFGTEYYPFTIDQ